MELVIKLLIAAAVSHTLCHAFSSELDMYCVDPDTGLRYPVNSTWPATKFCGAYTCLTKLVPIDGEFKPIATIEEQHAEEIDAEDETSNSSGRQARNKQSDIRELSHEQLLELAEMLLKEVQDVRNSIRESEKELHKREEILLKKLIGDTASKKAPKKQPPQHPYKTYHNSTCQSTSDAVRNEYNKYLANYYNYYYPQYKNHRCPHHDPCKKSYGDVLSQLHDDSPQRDATANSQRHRRHGKDDSKEHASWYLNWYYDTYVRNHTDDEAVVETYTNYYNFYFNETYDGNLCPRFDETIRGYYKQYLESEKQKQEKQQPTPKQEKTKPQQNKNVTPKTSEKNQDVKQASEKKLKEEPKTSDSAQNVHIKHKIREEKPKTKPKPEEKPETKPKPEEKPDEKKNEKPKDDHHNYHISEPQSLNAWDNMKATENDYEEIQDRFRDWSFIDAPEETEDQVNCDGPDEDKVELPSKETSDDIYKKLRPLLLPKLPPLPKLPKLTLPHLPRLGINRHKRDAKQVPFISLKGCEETMEPGKYKAGNPLKRYPECCPEKIKD